MFWKVLYKENSIIIINVSNKVFFVLKRTAQAVIFLREIHFLQRFLGINISKISGITVTYQVCAKRFVPTANSTKNKNDQGHRIKY